MSHFPTIPIFLGAVSAATSSVLEASINTGQQMSMLVPLVSGAIGAVFSYAVLKTTVGAMEKDMRNVREDLGQVYDLIRESHTRIARIEGRLDER